MGRRQSPWLGRAAAQTRDGGLLRAAASPLPDAGSHRVQGSRPPLLYALLLEKIVLGGYELPPTKRKHQFLYRRGGRQTRGNGHPGHGQGVRNLPAARVEKPDLQVGPANYFQRAQLRAGLGRRRVQDGYCRGARFHGRHVRTGLEF